MKKILLTVVAATAMLSACSTAHKVVDGAENLGSKAVQGVKNVGTAMKDGVSNTFSHDHKLTVEEALQACQTEDRAAFDACMKAKGFEKPTEPAEQTAPTQSEAPVVPENAKIAG